MIQPIRDFILVRTQPEDEKIGSLYKPDAYSSQTARGTVIACGDGTKDEPMPLSPGDKIIYTAGIGRPVYDGEELLLMKVSSVYAKVGVDNVPF